MITRPLAIQRLLDLFEAPRYLEIGVDHGQTFMPLKAARKVAVDPKFNFDFASRSDYLSEEFYEVTSDTYFEEIVKYSDLFDVIFLDGLHVAEQTVRDLLNSIMYMQTAGIIIIDDVIPSSYHASLASTQDLVTVRAFLSRNDSRLEADQSWMGDVYKLPFFIESFLQQFSYATIEENHGQTIMWREKRRLGSIAFNSLESIGRMEFKDFIRCEKTLNRMPFESIISRIVGREEFPGLRS